MRSRLRPLLLLVAFAALVGVVAFAYAPGLDGVFVFDSVERVVRNDALKIGSLGLDELIGAAYAGQAGYPQRGLAYVTLALDYHFAGGRFDPFAFKLTNLVIHCFNGLLVVVLAALILGRWKALGARERTDRRPGRVLALAVFAGGMWMLHPIQLTSVLYVVQRMTSLAGACVFMGAIVYVILRARFDGGARYSLPLMYANVVVFTGAGFLFKQNALLLPALIAVLEIFLFDRRLAAARRRKLAWYFAATLMIPLVAGFVLLLAAGESIGAGYASRDFGMLERVLTQARVLFFYLGLLLVPDIRRMGLFHDDIAASSGLLEPTTTLLAVLAWCVVVAVAVAGARRRAPWAFALVWFLVGHSVESGVLPLELVHEHRNYVPSAGVWIGVAFYAGMVWERAGRIRGLIPYALAAWVGAAALAAHVRAQAWRDPALLMQTLLRNHPQSYRAASGYAFNAIAQDADLGVRFDAFKRAAVLDDRSVSPLIEMSKVAMQLRTHLAGGAAAPRAPLEGSAAIELADMGLIAEVGHVDRILSALDREIRHRLENAPPRTDNAVALIGVVDCSLDASRACVELRPAAARWHASALRNPALGRSARAALELSTAKLHAVAGRYDEAVEHARRAGRAAGDNLAYRLQEATLYALLERWQALGDALDDIAARFPARARADARYRDLRAQHRRNAAR